MTSSEIVKPDSDSINMFIGQIPRSYDENALRELLQEYGPIFELQIMKEKHTGTSKGCGFVTFCTRNDALKAQMALHNLKILPGMVNPVQMKPADIQPNSIEHRRLFVGMLGRNMNEEDVRQMFEPFGKVDDCFLMKDYNSTDNNKGCGFVTMSTKEEAEAAIIHLDNSTIMEGAKNPINVKIAHSAKTKEKKTPFKSNFDHTSSSKTQSNYSSSKYKPSNSYNSNSNMNSSYMYNNPMNHTINSQMNNQNNSIIPQNNLAAVNNAGQLQQLLIAAIATSPLFQSNALGAGMANLVGSLGQQLTQTQMGFPPNNQNLALNATNKYMAGNNTTNYGQGQFFEDGSHNSGFNPINNYNGSMPPPNMMGMNGNNAMYNQLVNNSNGILNQYSNNMNQMDSSMSASMNSSGYGKNHSSGGGKLVKGPEGCNIVVHHIPSEYNDSNLSQLFSQFGPILSANVYMDKITGSSRGFGFVSFDSASSAQNAIKSMTGFQIGNKRLRVTLKTDRAKPY